jgi:hypothetical protein
MWSYFFVMVGILGVVLINIFTNVLITNEQNYMLLKETTEAAMYDSVDQVAYIQGLGYDGVTRANDPDSMHCNAAVPGTVRIQKEKFVESFLRRFAANASLAKSYTITFHEIDECPPKASVTIKSKQELPFIEFFRVSYDTENNSNLISRMTGILEMKRESKAD